MPVFSVHGPYDVVRAKTNRGNDTFIIDKEKINENVEQFDKYGCYVFAGVWAKNGNTKIVPWYVGKPSRQTLATEMFAPHKIECLNDLSKLYSRGGLVVFLIVPTDLTGAPASKVVDRIETYYIREAYGRDPMLLNKRKIPKRSWEITGVTTNGSGRRPAAAAKFRLMMMGKN